MIWNLVYINCNVHGWFKCFFLIKLARAFYKNWLKVSREIVEKMGTDLFGEVESILLIKMDHLDGSRIDKSKKIGYYSLCSCC